MPGPAISRFPVPNPEDMPDDIRARIAEVEEKAGFVPNVFLALAHRPEEFRAFFAYHDALMDKETTGLGKAEREMIVVATSARNQCQYCVIAHAAILRVRAKNPLLADQLASNYRDEGFARRREHRRRRYRTPARLRLRRRRHPDIGAISAFFGLSNRLANMSDLRANDEFYLLGRVAPEK